MDMQTPQGPSGQRQPTAGGASGGAGGRHPGFPPPPPAGPVGVLVASVPVTFRAVKGLHKAECAGQGSALQWGPHDCLEDVKSLRT